MTFHLVDDLDLGALHLFLGAIELGSVSKAAARYGITQPSATARLHKLERQLGARLLVRGPTGSTPTDAGAALVTACTEVLSAARRLVDAANDRRQTADVLRLAATRTTIDFLLPNWFSVAELDDVTFDVRELDTLGVSCAVRDGQAAMGLCDGPLAPLGLRSEVVATVQLIAVVAPTHILAVRRGQSISAGELADNADVIMRLPGSGTRDVIEAALAQHGFEPSGHRFEVPSNAAARLAAVNGSGVALLPRDSVSNDLAAHRLIELRIRDLELEQPVRLVWKGTQPATAAARRLRSALVSP